MWSYNDIRALFIAMNQDEKLLSLRMRECAMCECIQLAIDSHLWDGESIWKLFTGPQPEYSIDAPAAHKN